MKKTLLALFSLLLLTMTTPARADLYTFENGVRPDNLTGGKITNTRGYADYGFGDYFVWSNGEAITLTLTDLNPAATLNLEFDLAIIDSWDGSNRRWGTDMMNVAMNDELIFQETFSQFNPDEQSYAENPFVSGQNLYRNGHWQDSAYHISLTGLRPQGDSMTLRWFANGSGWQGIRHSRDESFAIDNIQVNPVPEPATMLLFGTGLAGLATLRRKRQEA